MFTKLTYKLALSTIFALCTTILCAQENIDLYRGGARSIGMANASIAHEDIWASFHNQANLAFTDDIVVGSYIKKSFGFADLASGSMALGLPTNNGNFFGNFSYSGNETFHQSKIGSGYAHRILNGLAIGVQFDLYNAYQAQGLGNKGAFTFELGLAGKIGDHFNYGLHYLNPSNTQLNQIEVYNIPSIVSLGGSILINRLRISSEAEKEVDYDLDFNLGLEYAVNDYVFARTGVSTGYSKYAFGVGFLFGNIQTGFSFAHHEILGYTPHFSLNYVIKTRENME